MLHALIWGTWYKSWNLLHLLSGFDIANIYNVKQSKFIASTQWIFNALYSLTKR